MCSQEGRALTYDAIGSTYSKVRRADRAIVHRLHGALTSAAGPKLLDIGAGTGNYSEALAELGWSVTAVEPSAVMRRQRRSHALLQWVGGYAENLPVAAQS